MDPVSLLSPRSPLNLGRTLGVPVGTLHGIRWLVTWLYSALIGEGISFTDMTHPYLQCVPKLYHVPYATVKCYNWICV